MFGKSKTLVGLDIGSYSVRAVELTKKGDAISLVGFGRAAIEGPEFVEGKSQNWEENLPESLQIISINLPSQQVLFSKISGYVSNYVSPMDLTLLEPSTGKTRIISINKLGVVEIK